MIDPGERQTIREDRALLLDFLNAVYPMSLTERRLVDSMLDLPRPVEGHRTRRDLAYLEDRGLIKRARLPHPVTGSPEIRVSLTADGVTFCEEDKPWGRIE